MEFSYKVLIHGYMSQKGLNTDKHTKTYKHPAYHSFLLCFFGSICLINHDKTVSSHHKRQYLRMTCGVNPKMSDQDQG